MWQLDVALVPFPDVINELILKTLVDVLEQSKHLDETTEISAQRISQVVTPLKVEDANSSERVKAESKICIGPDAIGAAFVELAFAALRRAREFRGFGRVRSLVESIRVLPLLGPWHLATPLLRAVPSREWTPGPQGPWRSPARLG